MAFVAVSYCNPALAQALNEHYAPRHFLAGPEDQEGAIDWPVVIDLDGDGGAELVITPNRPGEMYGLADLVIWTRSQDGLLEVATERFLEGKFPPMDSGKHHTNIADFNGDGLPDLFFNDTGHELPCDPPEPHGHCWLGGQNRLLLSVAPGKYTDATLTHLPQWRDYSHGSSAGDFDGDGDIDIWINNISTIDSMGAPYPYLLHNDGQGHLEVVADLGWYSEKSVLGANGILPDGPVFSGYWSAAPDVDGDGDSDLVSIRGGTWIEERGETLYYNRVWISHGAGGFVPYPGDAWPLDRCWFSPFEPNEGVCRIHPSPLTEEINVLDLDGDGLEDMISVFTLRGADLRDNGYGNVDESWERVLISNGDGAFRDETEPRIEAAPAEFITPIRLHDLDQDGHPDLFDSDVTDVSNFVNRIHLNDGEGFFRLLPEDWIQTGWLWVPLDVDGDGDTDILSSEYDGLYLHKMVKPYGPDLDGDVGDDRLIGGAHDNTFRGMAGDDVLDGGLGNDTLDGGPGDDTLVGGKGADRYVFHSGDFADDDTIEDKQGLDRIVFESGGPADIASVEQGDDGELILNFSAGGSLTVKGHFSGGDYSLERLVAGGDTYELPSNPLFRSGSFAQFLASGPFRINYALSDAWYQRSKAGQGFFIIVLPVLEQVFLAWFTYDKERPPEDQQAIIGGVGHLWLTAQGGYEGDTATLDVYLTEGGEFDRENPQPATGDPIGTITIVWTDCEHGTLSYDIPALGLSGEIPIERVVPDNVELCEVLVAP